MKDMKAVGTTRELPVMDHVLEKTDRRALEKFVDRIMSMYEEQILSITLYGSKVRGDFNQDSDIDVLVVVKERDHLVARAIAGIAFDVMLDDGPYISCKVFSQQFIELLRSKGDPFLGNVSSEGRVIWEAH